MALAKAAAVPMAGFVEISAATSTMLGTTAHVALAASTTCCAVGSPVGDSTGESGLVAQPARARAPARRREERKFFMWSLRLEGVQIVLQGRQVKTLRRCRVLQHLERQVGNVLVV